MHDSHKMKATISKEQLHDIYETHSAQEYKEQLSQIVTGIRAVLRPLSIRCHIKYRVKSFNEYLKKWDAQGGIDSTPIGDMLGIRIICPFLDDLHAVERALDNALNISDIDYKGTERSFSEFGYESTHMVLDLNRETIAHPMPGVAPVCEVQLRTILQDAWAEVEHELIYKSDWSIPTDQIRRKLAALNANLSLSDVIFQELRDFQKDVQHKQEKRRQIQNTRGQLAQQEELSRRLDTEQGEEETKEDLEKLVLRALTAHSDESFSRAIRLYSRILLLPAADPIRSIILNHRGMAYFALGENNAARADFRAALAIDDNNHRAWYNLGLTHQSLGDSNWALEAFKKSCNIEPNFFDAQFQRIRALISQKKLFAARDAIEQLSREQSEHPDMAELVQILYQEIHDRNI